MVVMGVLAILITTTTEAQSGSQETESASTVDPGAGTAFLDPELWGLLQKASAGGEVPDQISVVLATRDDVTLAQTLADHIKAVGGTNVSGDTWRIPTARTAEIIQRGDVVQALLAQDTTPATNSQLNDTLNYVVRAMASGIPATDAAQYAEYVHQDRIVVAVITSSKAEAASVQKWLVQEKVFIPESQRTANHDDPVFRLMLPSGKILPLVTKFENARIQAYNILGGLTPLSRKWRSAEHLAHEKSVTDTFLPQSEFYSTEPSPTPNAKEWKAINDSAALSIERHNVKPWHDHANELKGNGVKVGIIDWGYKGFNEIPHLPTMTKTKYGSTGSSYNAYCQKVYESIVPNANVFSASPNNCEPSLGVEATRVRHGNNIAELILRMAPKATLLMAQANSPQQVYKAATWLKNKGADVIVHAAGWQYDSPGNGVSYLDPTSGSLGWNRHDVDRYHPSPLYTVDQITENGPVWINAAGNHEHWTLWLYDIKLIEDEGGDYDGYVVFHKSKLTNSAKTCQAMPTTVGQVAYYSMRWADTWPNAEFDLDYKIDHKNWYKPLVLVCVRG